MLRIVCLAGVCAGLGFMSPIVASAQDAACKPLYDAARKALDQPGVERTMILGNPAKPDMTLVARKTATGWYQKDERSPWRAMKVDPHAVERRMLDDPKAFTTCVAGATENVNGEAARAWSYVTLLGPAPTSSRIWVSVARGLPVKVQGEGVIQLSAYQSTPFPKP